MHLMHFSFLKSQRYRVDLKILKGKKIATFTFHFANAFLPLVLNKNGLKETIFSYKFRS